MLEMISYGWKRRTPRVEPGCRAYTLVELIVVIGIIGMLAAILLPAVQAARETARRTECSNHLKQLTFALHNHHDVHRTFPSGGESSGYHVSFRNGVPEVGKQQAAGWGFQLLPYLEQNAVHSGAGAEPLSDPIQQLVAKSVVAVQSPVPVFFCPSRRGTAVHPPASDWYNWIVVNGQRIQAKSSEDFGHAQNDYAASSFSSNFLRPDGSLGSGCDGPCGWVCRTKWNDPVRPTDFSSIRDGTSNTFAFGDKRLNSSRLGDYQNDDRAGYTAGWDLSVVRRTDRAPMPDPVVGDGNMRFGSSHPGGVNMSMLDGSVRLISYDVEPWLFSCLGARDDSLAAQAP